MALPAHDPPPWTAFGLWAILGAGYSLGVLSILTIGAGVLVLTALATLALVRWWRNAASGAFGLISGFALPMFYVAYLNRGGPGTVCTSDAGGESCVDEWSPWPFVVVGIVMVSAGAAAFSWRRTRN